MTSDQQLWPKMTLLGFLGQGRRSMASCLNALNGGARSYGGYRQRLRLRTSRWFILPAFMFIFLGTIPKTFVRGNSIKSFEAVVSSSSSCLSWLSRMFSWLLHSTWPLCPSVLPVPHPIPLSRTAGQIQCEILYRCVVRRHIRLPQCCKQL